MNESRCTKAHAAGWGCKETMQARLGADLGSRGSLLDLCSTITVPSGQMCQLQH